MIKWLKRELKRLTCSHPELMFIRNIGGDEQMAHYVDGKSLARSEHKCLECGDFIYKGFRVQK